LGDGGEKLNHSLEREGEGVRGAPPEPEKNHRKKRKSVGKPRLLRNAEDSKRVAMPLPHCIVEKGN